MATHLAAYGLTFRLTCSWAPEQYDAYAGPDRVGYFRLRGGVGTVARYLRPDDEFPDFDAQAVVIDVSGWDRYKGGFDSDVEREAGLVAAALRIHELWAQARAAETVGGS